MSMFASALSVLAPAPSAVAALRDASVEAVVLPTGAECVVLVGQSDVNRASALFTQTFHYMYAEDHGLWVVKYEHGTEVLNLDFSKLWGDSDLVGEDGRYPDGTPGPELAWASSVQSVCEARKAQSITQDQADWLLKALRGEGPPKTKWEIEREIRVNPDSEWESLPFLFPEVARVLGFPIKSWLNENNLRRWTEDMVHYPEAIHIAKV